MIFIHIVSVCSFVIAHAAYFLIFCYVKVCSYIIISSQFEIIVNGEQQVKLPDPASPLMKEIPSSVISVANSDIESSMKESSTKQLHTYFEE